MLTSRSLLLAVLLPVAAFGQGSLVPPSGPAPTMKSLDQIEPRTPVAGGTAAVTISAAGSYYLTGNLTVTAGDAIAITAAGVTLDLGGFTVSSTASPAAGTAVRISGRRGTVYNGVVSGAGTVAGATFSGAGFANGVVWSGSIPQSITVHDVMVTGCSGIGIKATLVERCALQNVGTTGITGTIVRGCSVDMCGGTAIFGTVVSDCVGSAYATGIGGGSATNSSGVSNGADAGNGLNCTAAQNCVGTAFGSNGTGLIAVNAVGCMGSTQTGSGLKATSAAVSRGETVTGVGMQVFEGAQCSGEATSGGVGLVSDGALTGCIGRSPVGGPSPAIVGNIVIGCSFGGGTGLSAPNKYLMP